MEVEVGLEYEEEVGLEVGSPSGNFDMVSAKVYKWKVAEDEVQNGTGKLM